MVLVGDVDVAEDSGRRGGDPLLDSIIDVLPLVVREVQGEEVDRLDPGVEEAPFRVDQVHPPHNGSDLLPVGVVKGEGTVVHRPIRINFHLFCHHVNQ